MVRTPSIGSLRQGVVSAARGNIGEYKKLAGRCTGRSTKLSLYPEKTG
jgi:hypothetical protein